MRALLILQELPCGGAVLWRHPPLIIRASFESIFIQHCELPFVIPEWRVLWSRFEATELAIRAVRNLTTGGVIINGRSTWRTDQLAYGGVKDSGIGREGPRYSIRDMTEERIVLFNY